MENEPTPERRVPNEAQEAALRRLCEWYNVEYSPEHYYVYPSHAWMMPGYAEGWLGGAHHANPHYAVPEEPRGHSTIFVGVSPEGEVSS